jgi:YesN/AraC family two-component response regulator
MDDVSSSKTQTRPVQVMLADDHHLLRKGFRGLSADEPNLEVVGEASNDHEALELCRSLHPHIVLMDARMPEMDGLAATRAIKREHPNIELGLLTPRPGVTP